MDDGAESVPNEIELGLQRRQAIRVHLGSVGLGVGLTSLVLLL